LLFRTTSLTTRLFLASAVLLPLLLGFSATMLNHAYQRSLRAAERDALHGQIYILLGAAEPGSKGLQLPLVLSEPRYSSVNSGLLGWVVNATGDLQWRSRSSELIDIDSMPTVTTTFSPGRILRHQLRHRVGREQHGARLSLYRHAKPRAHDQRA
jgi:two-component system sensor histidine kinase PhoQ